MTVDLEQRLRDELAAVASTTRTEPHALEAILARGGTRPPRRLWRPALVAAAVLGLVLGTLVVRHPDEKSTLFVGLPPRPPAPSGSMVAMSPLGVLVRADVADPGEAVEVFPDGGGGTVLADGRVVRPSVGPRSSPRLITLGTSPSIELPVDEPQEQLLSVASMADGRVVMLVVIDSYGPGPRREVLRTFEPKDATSTDQPVPSSLGGAEVAAGPDGSIAVLGERGSYYWDDPELLIVRPGGQQRRHGLSGLAGKRNADSPVELSWGPSGLIALSTQRHHSDTHRLPLAWTLVVDPRTGDLVRAIDGYEGLAWSPDGSGLLTARITGPDTSQLAVWWGPKLKERVDLGSTRGYLVTPRWWVP